MLRPRIYFKRILGTTLFLPVFFSIFAQPALATCCKCIPKDATNVSVCIETGKTDCATLKDSKNAFVKEMSCTLVEGLCKSINEGGVCTQGPAEEVVYAPAGSATAGKAAAATGEAGGDYSAPTLGVSIPGLKFSNNLDVGGGEIRVPWFAQYINAIHTYIIGISVVVAAIAIAYGGVLYIVGSAAGTIQKGKTVITDALIGLFFVLGAYTILATLNPALVSPEAQNLQLVSRRDAFSDAAQERQRVEDAATVKDPDSEDALEVIDLSTGPSQATPESQAAPNAGVSGIVQPGEVAKDAQGNLIAQGRCPISMVEIPFSDAYPQQIPPFCIDLYEAPNQKGVKPIQGVTELEADWYCEAQGKRLCSDREWTRACLGPKGENTYGYGPTYIPGLIVSAEIPDVPQTKPGASKPAPCNYDSEYPLTALICGPGCIANSKKFHSLDFLVTKKEQSLLNPNGSSLLPKNKELIEWVQKLIKDVTAAEPSGSRPRCHTAEGVFDMIGNVQEIITTNAGADKTIDKRAKLGGSVGQDYSWANFYFSPIAHNANTKAKPTCFQRWGGGHNVGWRAWENGFRCCMNLNK